MIEAIEITGVHAFRDNRLWCVRRGRSVVVVDPGDAGPVQSWLADHGLVPAAVLLTHHHADHVGGVLALLERYPELPVYGPAGESITGVSQPLSGGEVLHLLAAEWTVMAVPGHTRGHLAYSLDDSPNGPGRKPLSLFSGDVLFGLGCGRLFEGSPEEMAGALGAIAALPDDTRVYCAHEYTLLNLPFARLVLPESPELERRAKEIFRRTDAGEGTLPLSLGEEKATNPFLRCDDPVVVAAALSHARSRGRALDGDDPVAVFATLREWRNQC